MAELTLFDGDTKLIYDKVNGTVHRETNADRIRAMSDKELAEFLMKPTRIIPKYECEDCENDCTECVLEWLKEEANSKK